MDDYLAYESFSGDAQDQSHYESAPQIMPNQEFLTQNSAQDFFVAPKGPISPHANQASPPLLSADIPDMTQTKQERDAAARKLDLDPYYSYNTDPDQLIIHDRIAEIFEEVQQIFGFQEDSMKNVLELFMSQLDSRASRFTASSALLGLHSDYIAGEHANYRKWYFCTMIENDAELSAEIDMKSIKQMKKNLAAMELSDYYTTKKSQIIEERWRARYHARAAEDLVFDLALYLQIWGEANNLRFVPEFLCFVFQCASDDLDNVRKNKIESQFPANDYLDRVITPVYKYFRDQQYKTVDGEFVPRERGHDQIIGYDDMNQLFWYNHGLNLLTYGPQKLKFMNLSKKDRYSNLGELNWKKAFYKTYLEKRSWWHIATNFSRIWIIHLNMFWYYSSFNSQSLYTPNYNYLLNNQPTNQVRFSVVALGSVIGCVIQFFAVAFEWSFVPRKWPGRKSVFVRLLGILLITSINVAPSIFVLGYVPTNQNSNAGYIVSIVQFVISIMTTLYFVFTPPAKMFHMTILDFFCKKDSYDPIKTFTGSYPKLKLHGRVLSILLWIFVFSAKFIESYFFLTLSLRDPIRNLSIMDITRCHGDVILNNNLCLIQNYFVMFLMFLTDIILFFLDTYLWYIVWNCTFSICMSFASGISMLSPWRNVFTRLPTRIYSKLLATSKMEIKYDKKNMVSQIWNAIIISMYRDHLLSQDHVHNLIYAIVPNDQTEQFLKPPAFFIFSDDNGTKQPAFFIPNSEAERRISFFAQSLSTSIPEPIPVEEMPQFTVFIPHYGEKIILSLKEIIRQDPASKISLLDYLKSMFPHEWKHFVTDTKIMAISDSIKMKKDGNIDPHKTEFVDNKINDLPLYCIGYKSSSPTYTMRTRLWASLRTQTLYRTVSGFMNYGRAIRLMHKVENPEMGSYFNSQKALDTYMQHMSERKFRCLVSVQKLQGMKAEELANVIAMTTAYSDVKVASLLVEENEGTKENEYFSVLYDAHEIMQQDDQQRKKCELKIRYKIKLSGNPILGDGKSDNQNMSIVYYRGEFIQVIDANQDNYVEECMKIRSVLAEFECLESSMDDPYSKTAIYKEESPVAIVGAREYIFSENTGVLGDVAASKEQTFGTMFARTLSEIGGKLHYGHPDFLNGIFMTTRGGISKAQKGLHLNEDIYAGINAIGRGGRIKHCDYFQCGKGRDLGFSSILNFTTKIGGGMGEQLISREYYYLGTQMSLDRFLSFYYAHPGFHINNLFIMFSLQVFMLSVVNMGAMRHELIPCMYSKDVPFTDLQIPIGCQNLEPVLDWVDRYVLSIFICFFISFLPLMLHELSERGIYKAVSRLFMHFLSMSPIFEVFVCQIYANSLKNDIIFGGARYLSTGRGFSITRVSFVNLYSSYAPTSIYAGCRLFLMLLFATVTMWRPAILWFWITLIALVLSPFIFNPHQFSWSDFFLDYKEFISWLSRGNSKWHQNSWITFTRMTRSRFTGTKTNKLKKHDDQKINNHIQKAPFWNTFMAEVIVPVIEAFFVTMAYMFLNSQSGVEYPVDVQILIRLVAVTLAPIILNALVLILILPLSCFAVPILGFCCMKVSSVLAALAHLSSVFVHIITFEAIWVLEGFSFTRTLILLTASIFNMRVIFQASKLLFLSRELKENNSNRAWWSGNWLTLGRLALTQPLREFIVKVSEMSLFAADFVIVHVIMITLTPILLIPYADHWHSCLMMWIKPHKVLKSPIRTISNVRSRRREASKYAVLYLIVICFFVALLVAPAIGGKYVNDYLPDDITELSHGLVQPNRQDNNDTGPRAPSTIVTITPAPEALSTFLI